MVVCVLCLGRSDSASASRGLQKPVAAALDVSIRLCGKWPLSRLWPGSGGNAEARFILHHLFLYCDGSVQFRLQSEPAVLTNGLRYRLDNESARSAIASLHSAIGRIGYELVG